MRGLARHAKQPIAAARRFLPYRATLAATVGDAVRNAPHGHLRSMRERECLGQALEARGNPSTVLLCELFRLRYAAAGGHGEDDFARGGIDAQRVAARMA